MRVSMRAGKWLLAGLVVCCVFMVSRQEAAGEPAMRTETRLSRLMPADMTEPEPRDRGTVERLLIDTWKNVERKRDDQDPSRLYASFQILVNIRKYELELYGIKDSAQRELLYSCRVGLGSEEYPTPRGSYYVTIIYDDKPVWIPPPRDWAYGQQPSRSVYGGHMMPFFRKIPVPEKTDQTVDQLDSIASPMKMVDTGTYRIHGTDSPWSVGSSQSHGCVRMLNKTVKELADKLKMYVGEGQRGKSENGAYVTLQRPVRLVLY
jgi:lipoprotein-anchoring transpeptidase ErfK/SrfK